jgi:hypothetical protein
MEGLRKMQRKNLFFLNIFSAPALPFNCQSANEKPEIFNFPPREKSSSAENRETKFADSQSVRAMGEKTE